MSEVLESLGARDAIAFEEIMLREAIRMSESAYSDSNSPRDLFVAWQAAMRLFDDATRDEIGGRLRICRITIAHRIAQSTSWPLPIKTARSFQSSPIGLNRTPSPPSAIKTPASRQPRKVSLNINAAAGATKITVA